MLEKISNNALPTNSNNSLQQNEISLNWEGSHIREVNFSFFFHNTRASMELQHLEITWNYLNICTTSFRDIFDESSLWWNTNLHHNGIRASQIRYSVNQKKLLAAGKELAGKIWSSTSKVLLLSFFC